MTRGVGAAGFAAVVLAALIAALGWVIASERTKGEILAVKPPTDLAITVQAAPDAGQVPQISPKALAEIAARPVFSPSRRPAEKEAARPVARQKRKPTVDFELVGVIATDDRRFALIVPSGSSKAVQLGEGDTYQDWTVSRIDAANVVLLSGDHRKEISLAYRSKK